jgi:copper chaperone CopZ
MTQQTFDVHGLRCGGCVNTVRDTLSALDGVRDVDVTLQAGSASVVTLSADRELDLEVIQRALDDHGEFRIQR